MDKIHRENMKDPTDELVWWAHEQAIAIANPIDRPWYFKKLTSDNSLKLDILCHCSVKKSNASEVIRLRRYLTVSKNDYLYIGQCRRCQSIHWGYVPLIKEKEHEEAEETVENDYGFDSSNG